MSDELHGLSRKRLRELCKRSQVSTFGSRDDLIGRLSGLNDLHLDNVEATIDDYTTPPPAKRQRLLRSDGICDDIVQSDSDLVFLNVGGVKFTTTTHTLHCSSVLSKFSSNTANTAHFIDRNGKYFYYILEFLRVGAAWAISILPLLSVQDIAGLRLESKFFDVYVDMFQYVDKLERWIPSDYTIDNKTNWVFEEKKDGDDVSFIKMSIIPQTYIDDKCSVYVDFELKVSSGSDICIGIICSDCNLDTGLPNEKEIISKIGFIYDEPSTETVRVTIDFNKCQFQLETIKAQGEIIYELFQNESFELNDEIACVIAIWCNGDSPNAWILSCSVVK